jgi:DNA-binding CsgD family transcriptional regulator
VPSTAELLHRVESACHDGADSKQLRLEVLATLRREIGFEGHLFALTDPVTRIATSPLADIPGLAWDRLPALISLRYRTPHVRWDTVLDSSSGAHSLSGSSAPATEWGALLRGLGVLDTVMVPLGDRSGCWGFVELWRTSAPFTPAEVGLLASVPSVLTPALRRSVARTFAEQRGGSPASGPAVVVLDDELRVSGQTAAAARTLLELNPPDEPMPPVPAAAYNVGAALLAGPLGPSPDSADAPWSRVRVGGSSWLTVRASRLEAQQIAVTIETCTPAERLDLYARACGLSLSETAVLELLSLGLDNKAIATQRSVSEHTVHDQVNAVLAKTGVSTRQVLLARALGGS